MGHVHRSSHVHEAPSASAFAPATIGNVGPGFDILGMAIAGPGDIVTARLSSEPGVRLIEVLGDGGHLPVGPENTAAIAAVATLERAGIEAGVELTLEKGMPIGSGLGSSAASAVAAAMAVNRLVGSPLRTQELIEPCVEAEAAVSGRHADNVAPALLGGLVLVRSVDPLDVVRLPVPEGLWVVVTTPQLELATRDARAALPDTVSMADRVSNAANIAAFVTACFTSDLGLLSRCIVDEVVNPARAALIPGGQNAIDAALCTGAVGSSISGAGPSIFALCRSQRAAVDAGDAMVTAFARAGLDATTVTSPADSPGARTL